MSEFINNVNGSVLNMIVQTAHRTCRFEVTGMDRFYAVASSDQPIVFSSWHGQSILNMGFFIGHYDTSQITILIPDDWRGDALAVLIKKLGAQPFPVNLTDEERSSMTTARRLVQLVRKIQKGGHAYIMPDGPEGPAYVVKSGATFIAQKAKAPIVPIGAYNRHGYELNRWDRYSIPYPFSRISIHVGDPFMVPPKADLAEANEELANRLHRVTATAIANYYGAGH